MNPVELAEWMLGEPLQEWQRKAILKLAEKPRPYTYKPRERLLAVYEFIGHGS